MSAERVGRRGPDVVLEAPSLADGRELWRVARDSGALDLNSPYSYLLWCRDFAATSVVARSGAGVCGFVTGYARPGAPDTVFVWQVAVDEEHRGMGLARTMLHHVADGKSYLEATVTPSNTASDRLFSAFARDRSAALERRPFLGREHFPSDHEPEVLYRIGPFGS